MLIKEITALTEKEMFNCEICKNNFAIKTIVLNKTISIKLIPFPEISCFDNENQIFVCSNNNCTEYLKLLIC